MTKPKKQNKKQSQAACGGRHHCSFHSGLLDLFPNLIYPSRNSSPIQPAPGRSDAAARPMAHLPPSLPPPPRREREGGGEESIDMADHAPSFSQAPPRFPPSLPLIQWQHCQRARALALSHTLAVAWSSRRVASYAPAPIMRAAPPRFPHRDTQRFVRTMTAAAASEEV